MKSLGNVRRAFAPWADGSAAPYIAFEGVTKRFGTFTAVDRIAAASALNRVVGITALQIVIQTSAFDVVGRPRIICAGSK